MSDRSAYTDGMASASGTTKIARSDSGKGLRIQDAGDAEPAVVWGSLGLVPPDSTVSSTKISEQRVEQHQVPTGSNSSED